MEVRFAATRWARLASDERYTTGLDRSVERKYRERVALIVAAADERDFYALKSLHYEKLKGDRSDQRSMRLNRQWRLVMEMHRVNDRPVAVVLGIEDYH